MMYEECRDSVVPNLTPEHSTGSNGIYRFEKTRLIPGAPDHTLDFLPHCFEAKIFVHEYIKQLSYIQHVVYQTSHLATIDTVYRQIHGH
jgi:hypothetical protein